MVILAVMESVIDNFMLKTSVWLCINQLFHITFAIMNKKTGYHIAFRIAKYFAMITGVAICIVLVAFCAKGGISLDVMPGENAQSEEDPAKILEEKLKLKADTALLFCKKNGMNTDFCLLTDMSVHSGKRRFFVWDFKGDSIMTSALCAHGYGKGGTQTKPVFSNVEGSYCTSLGKYKTGARSYSKWGINVHYKLHGLESTNSNAFKRIVVLHSYEYVPSHEVYPFHLPLGYSQGCPVIDNVIMERLDKLFKKQKKPTLLWIYI